MILGGRLNIFREITSLILIISYILWVSEPPRVNNAYLL